MFLLAVLCTRETDKFGERENKSAHRGSVIAEAAEAESSEYSSPRLCHCLGFSCISVLDQQ